MAVPTADLHTSQMIYSPLIMSMTASFLPVLVRRIAKSECAAVIRNAAVPRHVQLEITLDVVTRLMQSCFQLNNDIRRNTCDTGVSQMSTAQPALP